MARRLPPRDRYGRFTSRNPGFFTDAEGVVHPVRTPKASYGKKNRWGGAYERTRAGELPKSYYIRKRKK